MPLASVPVNMSEARFEDIPSALEAAGLAGHHPLPVTLSERVIRGQPGGILRPPPRCDGAGRMGGVADLLPKRGCFPVRGRRGPDSRIDNLIAIWKQGLARGRSRLP